MIERRKKNALEPELLALRNIKAIGTGSYHSFALSHSNELYVWGLNNYQQCGLWTEDDQSAPDIVKSPTVIATLRDKGIVKSVVGGEHHSLVLMENGDVYAFGRADSSQLGLPPEEIDRLHQHNQTKSTGNFKRAIGLPTKIPGLSNVVQISTGSNHAIAVTKDGSAYTWGFGTMLALGNGSEEDEPVPCKLTGQKIEGYKVIRASAGAQHTVILATTTTNTNTTTTTM